MSRKSYAANSVHEGDILIKIGEIGRIVAGDEVGKSSESTSFLTRLPVT